MPRNLESGFWACAAKQHVIKRNPVSNNLNLLRPFIQEFPGKLTISASCADW
jgi:hypothetical protein